MDLTNWMEVLKRVDATPPKEAKLTALIAKLETAEWTTPDWVVESTFEEVLSTIEDIDRPTKAFLRRAVQWINDTAKEAKALEQAVVNTSDAMVPLASQGAAEQALSLHSLLGNETSALACCGLKTTEAVGLAVLQVSAIELPLCLLDFRRLARCCRELRTKCNGQMFRRELYAYGDETDSDP